ncbi:MAG: SBBP repeat-containing protein [Bacteroidetes bacterium]|nr:SBBP repeat-containing protein [Bacteroidota bacterium]
MFFNPGLIFKAVCFLFLFTEFLPAQTPNWIWARSAGGSDLDEARKVATDLSGNIYVTGDFVSPYIIFGNDTLYNLNPATPDFFIVKYDSIGNVQWARSAGGADFDEGDDITCDLNGNIYVTGYYNYYPITFGAYTLTNSGGADLFLVKYDPSGNVLWAKKAGGNGDDGGEGIITDNANNIYVTGSFSSSTISFGTHTLSNIAYGDFFVAKYDAGGNCMWATSAGGNYYDYGSSIATNYNADIYVAGTFESTQIIFGNDTLTNTFSQNADAFLCHLDSAGNFIHTMSAGGTENDYGMSVTCDGSGNVFFAGDYYSPDISFAPDTLTNANWGFGDIFIVKSDPNLNELWARSAGGNSNDYLQDIACEPSGKLLLAGYFKSPVISFATLNLSNANFQYHDLFVADYDGNGNVLWAKKVGSNYDEYGMGIACDPFDNIYTTGLYSSAAVSFGNATLVNTSVGADIFLAKLNLMTGIEDNFSAADFSVFPDPFITSTLLHFENPLSHEKLLIYNSNGQLVREMKNISGTDVRLDRDGLPAGIYFLRIEESGFSARIIIAD